MRRSIAAGATLLTGGRRPERAGWFYEPTVLGNVTPGMAAFDEETFGPLAPITIAHRREGRRAAREPHALRARRERLDTRDGDRRNARARDPAGAVFVNGMVKSDPRLPFGGISRASGWGRELAAQASASS